MSESDSIRVGISSCLLGINVRYDGGHKKDRYLTDILGPFIEWVPVCPEVEVGMSTPREAIRLVGDTDSPRLVGIDSAKDWTNAMHRYATARVRQLRKENLDGYILKKNSPSCGMERVKVYALKGMPSKKGVGAFARVLMEAMPHLPIEEEGRLNDPRIRESFAVRVFAHHRWRQFRAQRFSRRGLSEFHARHKLLLMAHSEAHMRTLGRLVAAAHQHKPSDVVAQYEEGFFEALKKRATTRRHTNVLQHAAGYFKRELSSHAKEELQAAIEDYRLGLTPLVVPLTLVRHHVRELDVPYLADQVYLHPHPKELMILNHV